MRCATSGRRAATLGTVDDRHDSEAWARANVQLSSTAHTGKSSITWIARLDVEGLVFEQRARGEVRQRDSLRQRAADAVVSDYLGYLDSIDRTTGS